MSAERSTESIIDLLYGELSAEDAAEVRGELEASPALRAEHDELNRMLLRVREAMPPAEVPPTIHASIMDAARAGVPAAERAPRASEAGNRGFWSKVASGPSSQIALVAAVLVAGAFVVFLVNEPSPPYSTDIAAMQEAAPAGRLAVADSQPAAAPLDYEASDDGVALSLPAAEEQRAQAVLEPTPAPMPEPTTSAPMPKPSAQAAGTRMDSAVNESLRAELGRTLERGSRDQDRTASASAGGEAAKSRTVKRAPARKKIAPADANRPSGAGPSVDLFGADKLAFDDIAAEPTNHVKPVAPAKKSAGVIAEGQAAKAEAEMAPPAAAPAADSAESASINSVRDHIKRSDFSGAVREANNYLSANPDASANDKATAMHLKAIALTSGGRYDEADQVYHQIQTNYPSYQPTAIQAERDNISQRNTRPREQPAPARKSQIEFDSLSEPQ